MLDEQDAPRHRVLLIEDNPEDAELIRIVLARSGGSFDLHVRTDLASAAAACASLDPEILLTDLHLPDARGNEVITRLRSLRPHTPIVALTASHALGVPALHAGADDFVSKNEIAARSLSHTLRYAVERAASREALRSIIADHPSATIVVGKEGRVEFANHAALHLFGKPALVGSHQPVLESPDGTIEIQRPDGEVRTVELKRTRTRWSDGEARLCWLLDVTEQRRAAELERRLRHADKLATVGQLAAGVAHEVNNPAAFVVANLEIIHEAVAAAGPLDGAVAEVPELLAECREGMRRINAIVRQLTAFARTDEDEDSRVDLAALARVAARMVENQARHRVRLSLDLAPVRPIVGSEGKLCQAILNLLVNAIQAFEKPDPEQHHVVLRLETREDDAFIVVEDNGVGIAPEHLGRVFDPFFTTKASGHGTGLGLAVVQEIVRAHRGRVAVESTVGIGSRFTIRLPLHTGRVPSTPSTPELQPARRSILLIDDDALVLAAFSRLISSFHEVTVATDGPSALARILERRYDAVLCDLMIPGMSGAAIFREAVARSPELKPKFIFITGGAFSDEARQFIEGVRPNVLLKPCTRQQLIEAIEQAAAS